MLGGATVLVLGAFSTDTHGARVMQFIINGPLIGDALPVEAVVPAGAGGQRRPLLIFLHDRDEDQDTNLNDSMFAALARLGKRAPDVVFPYGGFSSFWHDRAHGQWGSYVMDQVLPRAVSLLHVDPTRVAIGGDSMGGFGALDLARLHPSRFCAVGAHSPALWTRASQAAGGAFDDAGDFARNDLVAEARVGNLYRTTPVWIDVGTRDPFRSADTLFATALRAHGANVSFHVWPGAHGQDYWRSHWNDYLRFYANALANCDRG